MDSSLAAWAAAHLVDSDGLPVRLEPWQAALLERAVAGQPLVLVTPRRPDRQATDLYAAAVLAMLAHDA